MGLPHTLNNFNFYLIYLVRTKFLDYKQFLAQIYVVNTKRLDYKHILCDEVQFSRV